MLSRQVFAPLGRRIAAVGLAALAGTSAFAKEVRLPKEHPQIAFDIPDDWTVTETKTGAELAPPDKSALIITGVVKKNRAVIAEWQKAATETMRSSGISFDPKATKPPPASPAPPSIAAVAPVAPVAPAAQAAAPTLFSGAPSIGVPDQGPVAATAFQNKGAEGISLDQLTGLAPAATPKVPFAAMTVYGASSNGTPVDVQFLNFGLAANQAFLMQQESGRTDDRESAIVDSVRRIGK